jgi:S-adenosyl-L-methionine hydrolase (adenosine-forming)
MTDLSSGHVRAAPLPPRITFLTDFGTADGYVAAMKAVIAANVPTCLIDDASHDIRPGDIAAGAWALGAYWRLYPAGTVHLAVVDPGVGSSRRALAVEADGRFLVGPDNGLFTHVLDTAREWRIRSIDNPAWMRAAVASTFHGRDIFAPSAVQLACGSPLDAAGPIVSDPVSLPALRPVRHDDRVLGVIVHTDHYGNIITNIPAAWIGDGACVRASGHDIQLRRTYADVAPGELLALIGSRGLLEISVRNGSAARLLSATTGQPVVVRGGRR